ncbi:MAG: ABC transporter permease [Verrucomicrobia bacterium]|nr:ABC transporter permease [Verrucomicrobiota bacterium]
MNDLKFAFRQLLKNPGFTAVAVLTLALGIGANTAIFSVVNAVLLRPLPYPDSGRLVWLSERGLDWSGGAISYPNFTDWKTQQSVFERFGVYSWNNLTLTGKGEPVQLPGAQMSADVFAALRVQPAVGRVFNSGEDKPGAASVVVISHALWQNRFGADPGIVNQAITLDGRPCTVLGVMPAGFAFPSEVDVWVPVGPLSAEASWQDRGNHPGLLGLARLKPGVTLEQARSELDTIAARLEQQYPESNKNRRVQADRLLDNRVGGVRRALWVLLGAVGLVLLIACANVANLLLARAAARQKEMAVRAALGAGRWRIVRQLLTESMLLAVIGAGVGLLLAHWGVGLILTLGRESIPRTAEIGIDGQVLAFSAAVAFFTGVLFGMAPAWQASRTDLQDALRDTARGTTGARARLRHGLVVAEVALTLVLLVGAGLLLRSFHRLLQVNPGFAYERVLAFRATLPERKYPADNQQIQFYQTLLENLRALPGVGSASVASQIPLDDNSWDTGFLVEGQPEPPPHERPSMQVHIVGPDYFRTMGIPVLRGREFTEQDDRRHLQGSGRESEWGAGLKAIVIDEEFARRHWPNLDPIGQRVRVPWGPREQQPVMTVVGVVGRIKEDRLSEQGGMVQAYLPFLQRPLRGMVVAVKSAQPPEALLSAVRQQVLALDPEQPIFEVRTLSEMRSRNIAPERLNLALLGVFAAVALALAVIGLYGVLSYAVAQRQREIGVRMALGAQPRNVLALVIGHGMRLALIGIGLGMLGALAITRVLRNMLFEVNPFDPLAFSLVTAILGGVALLACWIPARKATKVDPMVALRHE